MNSSHLRPVLTVTLPSRKSLHAQLILALLAWVLHTVRLRRAVARLQGETSLARRQARTDPLTGLGNRTALAEALAETSCGASTTLMMGLIDLDDFKPINDTYGHDAGDQVLRVVASRLHHAMAGHGSAYRLGGDEFAVLWTYPRPQPPASAAHTPPTASALPSLSEHVAQVWADRLLRHTFDAPVDVAGRQLKVAGSLGVAVNDPQLDSDRLLRLADESMYRAKRQTRRGQDRRPSHEAGREPGPRSGHGDREWRYNGRQSTDVMASRQGTPEVRQPQRSRPTVAQQGEPANHAPVRPAGTQPNQDGAARSVPTSSPTAQEMPGSFASVNPSAATPANGRAVAPNTPPSGPLGGPLGGSSGEWSTAGHAASTSTQRRARTGRAGWTHTERAVGNAWFGGGAEDGAPGPVVQQSLSERRKGRGAGTWQ
ncbi:hypothetical protein Kisp01_70430 [Kineosporia sp. NBRC 101677]|uniref:GGDEF domain-containing protein n=1 Tax=Kineosporia sp. NBRC 101677 TaxID=3032197 RepID=UPI0024A219E0|nr:GGDEF domain-containing protein [Kineosporia sp. NBRC 101677]GLY20029.1 hypothetical protein Kisp01_70430 [Kineosporia sp. NBRC 101677]